MGDGCCCGILVGAAAVYLLMPEKAAKTASGAPPVMPNVIGVPGKDLESKVTESAQACQDPVVEPEKKFLVEQIEHYQKSISPRIHELTGVERACKYEPSCSEYAKQAIQKYGNMKGSLKAASRLVRCNPASPGGYDPLI